MYTFILPLSIYLLLIVLFYALGLKKLKASKTKRAFLLASIPIAIGLNFIELNTTTVIPNYTVWLEPFTLTNSVLKTEESGISSIWLIYVLGVLIMFTRYSIGYIKLKKITANSQCIQTENGEYWISNKIPHVFSFGKRIFANSTSLSAKVLEHEQKHISLYHQVDKTFFVLAKILLWFHPGAYLLAHWSEENNETMVDEQLAKDEQTRDNYILLLKKEAIQKVFPLWVSPFSNTKQLKNRIKMMHKKKQTGMARLSITLTCLGLLLIAPIINTSCNNETEKTDAIEAKELTNEPLSVAEVMPEFKGGNEKLFSYLGNNITYPKAAEKENKEGVVFVSFVIDKDGTVQNAKILKGFYIDCDNEALRVVESMPNWTPGEQDGKKVAVQYNLPIKFTLN